MKNKYFVIGATFLLMLLCEMVHAQYDEESVSVGFRIPEAALIDIEFAGNGFIEFELLPAAEPGSSPVMKQTVDQELWINYSSALGKFSQNRSIVAQVTGAELPTGLDLYIQANEYTGTGSGETGVSAGRVMIGSDPRPVITGIGSAYTGNGIGNGHRLNFEIDISEMDRITANESIDCTILYTLTDN
ncbi:hypothetical protein SLH46_03820 [Draconibacterium sp. IB214405]|uniref:hypothetical protein n=1 Tax=Draconibacterium sp. IB214405 TaxID=3097352 RepID=UPI002A0C9388|nr:hypothetical protein [Draconibacterium sp. IB214405]MDX8338299.1 hypothetical protein [Draconibacterium sp. IB214405]